MNLCCNIIEWMMIKYMYSIHSDTTNEKEPLHCGQTLLGQESTRQCWDRLKCPDYRGVLISQVALN